MGKDTASPSRRSAGEGTIYTTTDGRRRGHVELPHPDGTRSVRRYVSGRTRAEVVRKLEALRKEGAAGFATGRTTGDYLASWIVEAEPRLRPSTHREYAHNVASYFHGLATTPLT